MSDIVVVYKSKYGYSEKYAKWISDALSADIFRTNQIKPDKLKSYSNIIYCGGLYAGNILGFPLIKKNYSELRNKKLIIAAVGATLKNDEAKEELKNKNLTDEMKNKVHFFVLRGGLDYKKLTALDRLLMYLMYKYIKKKDPEKLDNDSKGFLETYGKTVDFTDKKAIVPIIELAKKQ